MQAQTDNEREREETPLSADLLDGAAAAAEFLGLHRRKVYRMTEEGHLPSIRKGGRIFYRKSELRRAFQAQA